MTTYNEGKLERAETKGPPLYFYAATPPRPKVVVGLLHGYADHAARYAHVVEEWTNKGIAVVAIDMRGHGRAEGRRGHCDHFSEYLDDAAELTRLVRERFPALPPILFGHSFGGLVAASIAISRPSPWRALALSSPYFATAKPVPEAKRVASEVATRFAPELAIPSGLKGSNCTHDRARARAYEEDPLVFKTATARWFSETQAAQASTIERAPALTMPVLVVVGLADPIVSVPTARIFFDRVGSKDKTWDGREGLFHEVLNEVEWRPIADRFAEWFLAHAAG